MLTRRNLVADPRVALRTGWVGVGAGTPALITAAQVYSPNQYANLGETYTVSCELTAGGAQALTGTISAGLTVNGGFGGGTNNPTNINIPAGQTQRVRNTVTINGTANGFRLLLNTLNTADGTAKIDRVLIEKVSIMDTYFDGGSVSTDKTVKYSWEGGTNGSPSRMETLPNVTRKNWAPNPIVATATTGWANNAGGGAVTISRISSSGCPVADTALRCTWTADAITDLAGLYEGAGASRIIVGFPGVYTISAYVRASKSTRIAAQIYGYDSNGVLTTGSPLGGSSATVVSANTWTRISATVTMPANTDRLLCAFYSVTGTGLVRWVTGDTYDVSGMLIEIGSTLDTYFDGSTSWSTNKYSWYGAANGSESLLEPLATGYRRNYCINPQPFSGTGWGGPSPTVLTSPWNNGRSAYRVTAPGGSVPYIFSAAANPNIFQTGDVVTVSAIIQVPAGKWYNVRTHENEGNRYYNDVLPGGGSSATLIQSDGNPVRVYRTTTLVAHDTNKHDVNLALLYYDDAAQTAATAGTLAWMGDVLIEKGTNNGAYFDGATSWTSSRNTWAGAANGSDSFAEPATILRKNICPNPNLDTNITWWGALTGFATPTVSSSQPYSGIWRGSAIGNNTSTAPRVYVFCYGNVQPGDVWALSYRVKKIGTWPSGGSHYPALRFQLLPPGTEQVAVANIVATGPDANGWYYVTNWAIAPANCDGRIQINVGFLAIAANLDATCEMAWDEVLLEKSGSAGPYFDGNSYSDASTEYVWQSTINGSESYAVALQSNAGKQSDLFQQLVNAGYGPGSLVDMEYKRLLSKAGLTAPQKLSLYDLYALTGERPRIAAFRR